MDHDSLEALIQLRTEGELSPEEFAEQKNRLLKRGKDVGHYVSHTSDRFRVTSKKLGVAIFLLGLVAALYLAFASDSVVSNVDRNKLPAEAEPSGLVLNEQVAPKNKGDNWSENEQNLINEFQRLDGECRGNMDDSSCQTRDGSLLKDLNAMGICLGQVGQASYEYEFHRCNSESVRFAGSDKGDVGRDETLETPAVKMNCDLFATLASKARYQHHLGASLSEVYEETVFSNSMSEMERRVYLLVLEKAFDTPRYPTEATEAIELNVAQFERFIRSDCEKW